MGNIFKQAKDVLCGNLVRGKGVTFVSPDRTKYMAQFLWDSAFHSIAMSHFSPSCAKKELLTLVSAQRKDGRIPHAIHWFGVKGLIPSLIVNKFSANMFQGGISRLTMPPLISVGVERIYECTKDTAFVRKMIPSLMKFNDYLQRERDFAGDGLLSIIHNWESGMDDSPRWDRVFQIHGKAVVEYGKRVWDIAHKYFEAGWSLDEIEKMDLFIARDVLFNSIYLRNLEAMIKLLEVAGMKHDRLKYEDTLEQVLEAFVKRFWDRGKGLFQGEYSRKNLKLSMNDVSALSPIFIKSLDKEKVRILVEEHLLDPREYWTLYPVPTVAVRQPQFSPKPLSIFDWTSLWRGPTWLMTNWLLFDGLFNHGYKVEAKMLAERTRQMIERSGFREQYNPYTAEGYGAERFASSALIVDMLKRCK